MKNGLPSDIWQLLGGLPARRFLARYWQKKPLLIRAALPHPPRRLSRALLFGLSARDDAESRIVTRRRAAWSLEHGPFSQADLRGRTGLWTLLVQGVNLFEPAADALLRRFDFIPHARLDDLMISWASDGGGVGPHVDSYDVFLLQLAGRRRWRLSFQRDQATDARAPHKLLARFRPAQEFLLEPGDMLYLPPGVAHEGTAVGECLTASIGFRAPSATELARGVLEHLAETVTRAGRLRDPGRRPTMHPGFLDDRFVAQAHALVGALRPTRADLARVLGASLSEPKPQVVFDAPRHPLPAARFAAQVRRAGLRLDLRTGMLYRGKDLFINGETLAAPTDASLLRELADHRRLGAGVALPTPVRALVYAWYTHGWLHPGEHS
jgi:50S ribosomal protein L16 3-hydroxylase